MSMTRPTTEQITHNGQILKDVLGPIANVMAYGAKGDGVADDTAAIQFAVDTGSVVYLPAGTYKVTSRILGKSNMTICGDGPGVSRIVYTYEQQSGDATLSMYWAGALGNQNAAVLKKSLFLFLDDAENIEIRDLFLQYSGTFDQGTANGGKIAAMAFGFCRNVHICNVHATGWNHSCFHMSPHTTPVGASPSNVSRNITIEHCVFFENRSAGIWLVHAQDVRIDNCVSRQNGIAYDSTTGYGITTQSYATWAQPSNLVITRCLIDSNRRSGISHQAGSALTVANCRFTAPTSTSADFMQHTHLFVSNTPFGRIVVTNNDFGTLRQRTADTYTVTAAIHLLSLQPATGHLAVVISGNTFSDIDVESGPKQGNVIRFAPNNHSNMSCTITDNIISANRIDFFVAGDFAPMVGAIAQRSLVMCNNTMVASQVYDQPVLFGNLRTATISNNTIDVQTASKRFAYNLIAVSGETLNGKVRIVGNDIKLNNYINVIGSTGFAHEAYGNTCNGAQTPNMRVSLVSSTYKQLSEWVTGTTNPVDFFVESGSLVHYSNVGSGAAPGAYCVDRTQRTLASQALAGATTLTLTASIGGTNGDPIAIILANGDIHKTTIASGAGTTSVTITDAMPSNSNTESFNVVRVGWKALAAIA